MAIILGKKILTVFIVIICVSYSSVSQLTTFGSTSSTIFQYSARKKNQFILIASRRYIGLCRVTKPVSRVLDGEFFLNRR